MTSQLTDFPVISSNQTITIKVPNRLSVLEAVSFKQTCEDIIQAHRPPQHIMIDFQKTTFMDSSGLGALVSNFKHARENNITLTLHNVTPQVMAVLNLTGLDEILPIVECNQTIKTETENISNVSINHKGKSEQGEYLPTTHASIACWLKRFIDIVGAIVGLIITGVLFIPIVIAIQLDNPGPIFFRQVRCGWMGKRFKIWKFRSMCVDAEAKKHLVSNQVEGAFFKNDNDPRITRVGRFLRRTSLDELPQFWNVLKGDMSLVGTRPPTPDEVERYQVPEWQRLDVKPGMTGEWQVKGRSNVRSFEDVIRLDLQYQRNWSLLYDTQLILQTVAIVFNKNSGAM